MNKTYETANTLEKALGKAHQYAARALLRSPRALPADFRGVSFCFDDFPRSAADTGAKTLEDHGARATFYTCFGLLDTESYGGRLASLDQVLALAENKHDIGCHTYDHVNCSFVDAQKVAASCDDNIRTAEAHGIRLKHFSYPQGGMSLGAKKAIRARYATARSSFQGINRKVYDPYCLMSMPLYDNSIKKVNDFIDNIADKGGWLILYTHDISHAPTEHGISTHAFTELVAHCMRRQLPMRSVNDIVTA